MFFMRMPFRSLFGLSIAEGGKWYLKGRRVRFRISGPHSDRFYGGYIVIGPLICGIFRRREKS